MAYATAEMRQIATDWENAIPSAVCSGIVGDRSHTYGYHRAANEVSSSDYSLQLPGDRNGVDWNAADAIDMSHNRTEMQLITRRFYDSWKSQADLRLNYTREIIGTLDGTAVIYMDTQSGRQGSSDASHLWHIHIGGLRCHTHNPHAMAAILSIVVGQSWVDYCHTHPDDPITRGAQPLPPPPPPGVPGPPYMAWPGRYLQFRGPGQGVYMNGEDVLHYQLRMLARGWDLGPSGADAAFGPVMDGITRQYQRNHSLSVDGVVGARTWESVETTPVS